MNLWSVISLDVLPFLTLLCTVLVGNGILFFSPNKEIFVVVSLN